MKLIGEKERRERRGYSYVILPKIVRAILELNIAAAAVINVVNSSVLANYCVKLRVEL